MTQASAELGEALPLLETKLVPPRLRPPVIARPRLLAALDRFERKELTLVSAPAGGGKSVLVGSWCAARAETAVAWVSLDAADDDPVRLWTYVATAVDRVQPGVGRLALGRLRDSGAGVTVAVDALLNGLATLRQPLAIVLDDIHQLRDETTLHTFEHAVENLPPGARLIALTRSDPLIRLGRLRARGALGEIRARELAFTVAEARELLVVQEGIELDDTDLELLVERSEGWPAGVYLAALWLRGHASPRDGVRDLTGDHRHVADYLSSEVIEAVADETRDFLLRTSVLGRLSGPMCDAVLDTTGSNGRLVELARSNLFLTPLDGRGEWYRYHHLFGELLRVELRRGDPASVAELHRRAAVWCRGEGLIEEALEYAATAGDRSAVAEILLEHHRTLVRTGRSATLLRWVEALGAEEFLDVPDVLAAAAIASGLLARPASQRGRLLELVDRATSERPSRATPYLESVVSLARGVWIDGDVGRAVANARRAADVGRAGADEIAVPALGALAFALHVQGEHEEARGVAQEALERHDALTRPHGLVYALATLALVELEEGRAVNAEAYACRALDVAADAGLSKSSTAGLAHCALAAALTALGEVGRAEREAERGEAARSAREPTAEHVHALLVLAEARAARGRLAAAAADLDRASEMLAGFADPGKLPERAASARRALDAAQEGTAQPVEQPSPAELAVLRLLAGDLTQREIGRQLYLSLNTVKTHTRSLYRKLGATSRDQAVARAKVLELLEDEPAAI